MRNLISLNLESINNQGAALQKPGVYKIYCKNPNGNSGSLNRLLQTDNEGLLYIGASKNKISYRLECFIKSMNQSTRQNNHAAAFRVSQNPKLLKFILEYQLCFEYTTTKAEDALDKERDCLKEYKHRFGELPPLNG